MPDHQPLTTSLTLTAGEFATLHEHVLYDGGRTVGEYRDPCGRGALADLVAWLPDLTAEAYADPFLPRSRRSLAAAGAWLADAALAHDDQHEVACARARAAELARVRLAAYAARPDAEALTESVQQCARALARALDPCLVHGERREMIAAVHGELLAVAVLRTQPPPTPAPPPVTEPLARHHGWTARGAARAALLCAEAAEPPHGLPLVRDAVSQQMGTGGIGLTAIVGALPALALDAIWLGADGAGLDAGAARTRLERANALAAATLIHSLCALEEAGVPATRQHVAITKTARQRLVAIVSAKASGIPALEGIDRCARSLADALTAGPADEVAPSLWIVAGELAAVFALTNACQRAGAAPRQIAPLRRGTRGRGGRRRR